MAQAPAVMGEAREQLLALVGDVRPELHRYCARLTGSVVEGEDIVQETLARALYALSMSPEIPPLRPWLFRIAHNAALDFLKSHAHKYTEPRAELEEVAGAEEPADPAVVRAALSRFLALPVAQRCAVILKDVLGHSLEETAETMGATVMAVKAALVRGRTRLRAEQAEGDGEGATRPGPPRAPDAEGRELLARYASLFNARDWEGLRALVADDCRLDLVSKSQRRGKEVRTYFARYENEDVTFRVVRLEGRLALAVYRAGAEAPAYFVLIEASIEEGQGRVQAIRDFRYVPYLWSEAEFEPA